LILGRPHLHARPSARLAEWVAVDTPFGVDDCVLNCKEAVWSRGAGAGDAQTMRDNDGRARSARETV
jgi:hypothetical protein